MKAWLLPLLFCCSIVFGRDRTAIYQLDLEEFMRRADELTLYSIDPDIVDSHLRTDDKPTIQGRVILSQVVADTPEIRETIRAVLLSAFTDIPEHPPMMCLEPEIALRLACKGRTLEVLLSYQCQNSAFYYEGGEQLGPLGPRGLKEFTALLREHSGARGSRKKSTPNQVPEPTSGSVTPRADARVAPPPPVAHR